MRGPSAGSLLRMAFLLLPLDPGQPAGSPSTGDTTTQPTDDGLPALGSAISGLLIEGEKAQDGVPVLLPSSWFFCDLEMDDEPPTAPPTLDICKGPVWS